MHHEDWVGRRLVAERFRDGNVFIAGDAAHLWVPYAGYGMNAGIADSVELAWLFAAVLDGWAPEAILDSYEAERLPITDQVSRLAMDLVLENAAALAERPPTPELADPGPTGEELRATIGPILRDLNVPQFAPEGLNFGYFYDASPIIAYDGAEPPATRWARSRRRRCPVAACRTSRSTVGPSSTTSVPTTRSSGSTPTSTSPRSSTPPRRSACRSWWSTRLARPSRPCSTTRC